MSGKGYKKYMKKNAASGEFSLIKIFAFSFFGMLLVFTLLIKSFTPSVDVSIGEYQKEYDSSEDAGNVDRRLAALQDEDQGKSFSELMSKAEETKNEDNKEDSPVQYNEAVTTADQEPMYKVYIGSYTSAEQAKVAKDIIQESGANLNPIVKCIGSNNYALQVGIFKSKQGADTLLQTVQQNHLPGRVVKEY